MPLSGGVRGILLDIEGTTTPISFVYDILFPYAEQNLEEYCRRASAEPELKGAIQRLHTEYEEESQRPGIELPEFDDGAPYARYLMSQDRKSTGLKLLQGLIWKDGYESERLHGDVFPDVPGALEAWRQAGLRLRVFSSGSVLAQKLLFGNTEYGDLTGYFEEFHDTTTGPKKEPDSYAKIAEAFDLPAAEVLFLSDVVAELDAAAEAGMRTGLFLRPGNRPAVAGRHPAHRSFSELV